MFKRGHLYTYGTDLHRLLEDPSTGKMSYPEDVKLKEKIEAVTDHAQEEYHGIFLTPFVAARPEIFGKGSDGSCDHASALALFDWTLPNLHLALSRRRPRIRSIVFCSSGGGSTRSVAVGLGAYESVRFIKCMASRVKWLEPTERLVGS